MYVSTQGDDEGDGSEQSPFATLHRARNEIRNRKEAGFRDPAEILIGGGFHYLPNGIRFEARDGGSETATIVYRARDGETPILVGGRAIAHFEPHSGAILKTDWTEDAIPKQLIFNGRRQHLARYPNFDPDNPYGGGWAYAAGKRIPMYQNIANEPRNEFVLEREDRRNWAAPEDLEIFVFARYNWFNDILKVKSIDPATGRVLLDANASFGIRPGDRFYLRNALEELDSPGEWFYDRKTKTLYFWPPSAMENQTVVIPSSKQTLLVDGASDLVFRNLSFEGSEGTAVVFKNASRCRLETCTLRNVGNLNGGAVGINGGSDNIVYGCDISEVGSTAISLVGGDPATLTGAGHVAENNYVHHFGVYYKQGVALSLAGVGQRASHNLIHDGPRFACLFNGHNHVIEYNHVRHTNLETSDTGAFYTGGRDWLSARGTVLRYNFIHDVIGYGKDHREQWVAPYHAWGIYLDDNAAGVDIIGNILLRCSRAGINLHNGRDNHIRNNIFVDARFQQLECNGWKENDDFWTRTLPSMIKGYESVAGRDAWKSMRNMNVHPADAILPDKTIMSNNVFERNIVCYDNPKTQYVRFVHFSTKHNIVDHNLIWNNGGPILTGCREIGEPIAEIPIPNGDFKEGRPGSMPPDWSWQSHPSPQSKAVIEVAKTLRIDADARRKGDGTAYPVVHSARIPIEPGKSYRLRGRFRTTESKSPVTFSAYYWSAEKGSWSSLSRAREIETDWQNWEQDFTVPKSGETGYVEGMKNIRISIGFRGESGSLVVGGLKLHEMRSWEHWEAWRRKGMDTHSLIADPLFVGEKELRSTRNYADVRGFELRRDSPAWKLGFERIAVERIGPYGDSRRASWPIVEAEGAREKPLVSNLPTY